jgi:hypothetical protein
MKLIVLILLIGTWEASGCRQVSGGNEQATEVGGDRPAADGDTDVDTHADTETAPDTDTNLDVDTVTDADTATVAEIDTDVLPGCRGPIDFPDELLFYGESEVGFTVVSVFES